MKFSRRTFLKGAGAGGAAAAASRLIDGPGVLRADESPRRVVEDFVPTTCWIGKQDCGLVARRIDGRVVSLEGLPAHPRNQGGLCPKGVAQITALYDPNRILAPLVRTNGKGVPGEWRRVTWDEALELVAERIRETRAKDPSLVVWQKGRSKGKEIYDEAFPGAIGATKVGHGVYCSDAGYRAAEYTIGLKGVLTPDFRYARYVLAWGWNITNAGGNQLCWITWNRQLQEARERGLKVVSIDPRIRAAAHFADEWLPIRPGTDLALALAFANVLIREGYVDREYLTGYTNAPHLVGEDGHLVQRDGGALVWDTQTERARPAGQAGVLPALEGEFEVDGHPVRPAFQVFADYVESTDPEWAADICGVPGSDIRRIASEFGRNASIGSRVVVDGVEVPLRPVGIMTYHAMQQEHGFQASRAIMMLTMLVGGMGAAGGSLIDFSWKIDDKYHGWDAVEIHDAPYDFLLKDSKFFPINSVSPSVAAMAMLEPETYGVQTFPEVMILHMANPLGSFGPQIAIEQGYLSKIPFIAGLDPWMSETLDLYGDVVLPTATMEKYEGPIKAGDGFTDATTLRVPVMEPLGESRGEIDIYLDLAQRVGVLFGAGGFLDLMNGQLALSGDNALSLDRRPTPREIFDRWAKNQGIEEGVAYFEQHGVKVKGVVPPSDRYGYAASPPFGGVVHRFYGESLLRYREEMRDLGAPEVFWRDYTPLPTWRPPTMEGSPPAYDLYLTSFKVIEHKQSRSGHLTLLEELAGRPRIDINPKTAAARGIEDGAAVRVESHNAHTGETRGIGAVAHLTETIRPDVVGIPHLPGTSRNRATGEPGPSANTLLYTGPGYLSMTGDQSFHVKVRVFPLEGGG
jgi:anaerobic selenocysteine-containing dehydrogenase